MGHKRRASTDSLGRIWFAGNPWPGGHELRELEWSARLEADGSLWFDLHAVTRSYRDEYPESLNEEDSDPDSPWSSTLVWCNYHATSLSSTKWRGDAGFQVATPEEPLRFANLGEQTFEVDRLPLADDHDDDDFAFHVYCLGHDAVAGHKIRLTPRSDGRFDLEWTGLHANAYVGDMEFKNPFRLVGIAAAPLVRARNLDSAQTMLAKVAPDATLRVKS